MNFDLLKSEITNIITDLFPNSFLRIEMYTIGGESNGSMFIHFAHGKDKSEWLNGIIHNDKFHSQLWIHGGFNSKTGEIVGKLTTDAGIYGIRKDGKFLNLGFRKLKTNVTEEKIIKMIGTYFTNMFKEVK